MKIAHLTIPIFESPINKLELIGSFDKKDGSPFNISDQKLLKNPKHIEKIRDSFNRTKFKFNMYMINHPDVKKIQNSVFGFVPPDWIYIFPNVLDELRLFSNNEPKIEYEDLSFVEDYEDLPFEDNAINVLYLGNFGDNLVPMTPWIIAHRLGHALQRDVYDQNSINESLFIRYHDLVDSMTIFLQHERISEKFFNQSIPVSDINSVSKVWYNIGKFKSARNKNLSRDTEIYFELIAQYIITGKIEFNELPKINKDVNNIMHRTYNRDIQEYAKKCEEYIETMLKNAIGQILVI